MQIEGDEEIVNEEEGQENETSEFAQISMHALVGVTDYQALRITGHVGKNRLQVLLDTSSTHNFIKTSLAMKLGCTLVKKGSMSVRVGNGEHIIVILEQKSLNENAWNEIHCRLVPDSIGWV